MSVWVMRGSIVLTKPHTGAACMQNSAKVTLTKSPPATMMCHHKRHRCSLYICPEVLTLSGQQTRPVALDWRTDNGLCRASRTRFWVWYRFGPVAGLWPGDGEAAYSNRT